MLGKAIHFHINRDMLTFVRKVDINLETNGIADNCLTPHPQMIRTKIQASLRFNNIVILLLLTC